MGASYLNLGLWPFLRLDLSEQKSIEGQSVAQDPHSAKIQFNRMTPTFDLIVNRPQEKIEFRQIRLPYGLNHVLPLKAGLSNAKLIAQKVTGSVLYPLFAADCSEQKSFAVLLRELSFESKREVKII